LAGVHYNTTNTSWVSGAWSHLPAVEVAAIIFVFFLGGFGFITFWCDQWLITTIFALVLIISTLFTYAVAIFGLVAGSIQDTTTYIGCNSPYQGVIQLWQTIDNYLVFVDSQFCQPNCPCMFNNPQSYANNASVAPFYDQWSKGGQAIQFQNCSTTIQTNTFNTYLNTVPTNGTPIVNQMLFHNYWGTIETRFNCTGWCTTGYPLSSTQNMIMYKYLFSDIGRGVPTNLGCLASIANWLPPLLAGFGAVALVAALVQTFVVFMAFSLCCAHQKGKEEKINEGRT